jgi:Ser/Thr protein kinase RdoA (MazF antagonist)
MLKPYPQLTRIGRLRRLRQLAGTALEAYGLADTPLKLQLNAGKTLFRVDTPNLPAPQATRDLFEENRYLLQIHHPTYQTPEAAEMELNWLAAMRREADLPVPEPIPSRDGRLMIQVTIPGTTLTRHCSLLRWVKGRHLLHQARAEHYRAQGRLMARMHNFASGWQIQPNAIKRHYDWDGLFMNDAEIDLQPGESWKLLPQAWVEPFESVARQMRQLMEAWGKGPDVYGLIHADMGVDANVLFWRGEPRLIDFESSGFGYWMYDLAVSVEHIREDPAFAHYRDALLDGYAQHRSLPAEQLAQLELFLAATSVYWDLWAVGGTHVHPEFMGEYRQRIAARRPWYYAMWLHTE